MFSKKKLEAAIQEADEFAETIKDAMSNEVPVHAKSDEVEPQTKLSQSQIRKKNDIYLKPEKTIQDRTKFNEKFRKDYEFEKEYVNFIYEHSEIRGDALEIWTKKFAGVPAEYWIVPPNVPVWGPRYLAEQIANCKYNRLMMDETAHTGINAAGSMYGKLVISNCINRLNAFPVNSSKSVFM